MTAPGWPPPDPTPPPGAGGGPAAGVGVAPRPTDRPDAASVAAAAVAPAPRPPSAAQVGAHPAIRAVALLVGAAMTAVVVGLSAYVVASLMVSTTERGSTTLRGPVTRVEAHVRGSLTIRAGAEGEVRMTRRSTFGFVAPLVEASLDEATGTATVRVVCRGLTVECENRVTLVVPAGVEVDVSSDHTTVEGIEGGVRVSQGGGAVDLRRLRGPLDVRVGGGAVIGEDLTSAQVRVSAGAGAVELAFAAPPDLVDVDAGAGRILVQLPPGEATYRVDADAGAGDQRVGVATDPNSSRLIRARTHAGDVEVAYRPT